MCLFVLRKIENNLKSSCSISTVSERYTFFPQSHNSRLLNMTSILVVFFAERNEPSQAFKGAVVDLMGPFDRRTFSLIAVPITLFRGFSLYIQSRK